MLLTFEAGGDEVFTSGYAGQVKYQKDGPRTGPLCVDVIFFWGMPGWDKGASDARIGDFEKLDERFQEPAELKQQEIIKVDTECPVEETLDELYQGLINRNFILEI